MIFKIILFIVVVLLVLRYILRILIPSLLGNFINNKFSEAQNNYRKANSSRRDGDVSINYTSKNEKKYKVNDGEYVDFEEIKE